MTFCYEYCSVFELLFPNPAHADCFGTTPLDKGFLEKDCQRRCSLPWLELEDARTMQRSFADTLLYTVFLLNRSLRYLDGGWWNLFKPQIRKEMVLPEVISRLSSTVVWVGLQGSRTMRIYIKSLLKYMGFGKGGA